MRFTPTALHGTYVLEPETKPDDRGYFARAWCEKECAANGIDFRIVQCNLSFNRRANTLRGMHYQAPPHAEAKVIRCTRGRVYDVLVDLRPDSPSFRKWVAYELTPENRLALYAPAGLAHGFQTLEDESELFYLMSAFHHPESARGVRWDDPAFGIKWPDCANRLLCDRDRSYPDFTPEQYPLQPAA